MLQKGDATNSGAPVFDPAGRWLMTAHGTEVAFWPLAMPRGRVVRASAPAQAVLFGPDGRRLVALMADRAIRTVPLFPGEESRTLFASGVETPELFSMAADPSGRRLAVSGFGGRLVVVGLDGASAETLEGFPPQSLVGRPAFSHDGRLLAAGVNGVRYRGRENDSGLESGDGNSPRVWPVPRRRTGA